MTTNRSLTYANSSYEYVSEIEFGMASPDEIRAFSVVEILHDELLDRKGNFKPNGLFDLRMGTLDKGPGQRCQTCGHFLDLCPGHFGRIELNLPLFHTSVLDRVTEILKCVCPACSRLLLTPGEKKEIGKMTNKKLRFRETIEKTRKKNACDFLVQREDKGTIRTVQDGCGCEIPSIKLVNNYRVEMLFRKQIPKFLAIDRSRSEGKAFFATPSEVLRIFSRINEEDYRYIACNKKRMAPPWLIITVLPVPPPNLRPTNKTFILQRKEDDLTRKLEDIVRTNIEIGLKMKDKGSRFLAEEGSDVADIKDLWTALQYHVAIYFNAAMINKENLKGLRKVNKRIKGIEDRIRGGKEGRVRRNLMGKRTDYNARTVITPDPNLRVNEVGVPYFIARTLTFPDRVTPYNLKDLQERVDRGPEAIENGAIMVEHGKYKYDLKIVPEQKKIRLETGMVVHRHMKNGDPIPNNRMPSLHRFSMMGHRARIMPGLTLRINPFVCTPYNADFDGDEMNLTPPQNLETKAEVEILMMVERNVLTPQSNKNIMGIVQDGLVGLFLLSKRDVFLDRHQLYQLACFLGCYEENGTLPVPAISQPRELWTGKQLIGMVLPNVNLERCNLSYDEKEEEGKPWNRWMTPSDTRVRVYKGEILSGIVDRRIVGPVSGSLLNAIALDYDSEVLLRVADDLSHVGVGYVNWRGLSITIGDIEIPPNMDQIAEDIVARTDREIESLRRKGLTEGDFEKNVEKLTNGTRNLLSSDVTSHASRDNGFLTLVLAGSKGNKTNYSQGVRCVGQQNVEGRRPRLGFDGRSLPHVSKWEYGCKACGFVSSSYAKGLGPLEFFFHAMAGREGLTDTAVKTSKSGYIQRKLSKSMEDFQIEYDGTVRNCSGDVIQFHYGEDDLDASRLQNQEFGYKCKTAEEFSSNLVSSRVEILKTIDTWFSQLSTYEEIRKETERVLREEEDILLRDFATYRSKTYDPYYSPFSAERSLERYSNATSWDYVGIYAKTIPNPRESFEAIRAVENDIVSFLNVSQDVVSFSPLLLYFKSWITVRNLYHYRISGEGVKTLLKEIERTIIRARAEPGDMVGMTAAQSIGEPSTQMTLNSVAPWERILIQDTLGNPHLLKIGEWIDALLLVDPSRVNYVPENRTQYLELQYPVTIATPHEDGNVSWEKVIAVTKHLPVGDMVKIVTRSGREVTATQSKSFLIWDENKLIQRDGKSVKVGDRVPIISQLPDPPVIITELDLKQFFGSELNSLYNDYTICGKKKFWITKSRLDNLPYSRGDSAITAYKHGLETGLIKSWGGSTKTIIPEKFRLTKQFGQIVGLYLAEGWVTDTFVGISINAPEIQDLVYKWCDYHGITHHTVAKSARGKTTDVTIHSVLIARWFKKWMNTGSGHKIMPPEVLLGNREFVVGVLDGYFAGDGTVNQRDGYLCISSASKDLITGFGLLCSRLGIFGKQSNNIGSDNIRYANTYTIRNKNAVIWANRIGSCHKEKRGKMQKIESTLKGITEWGTYYQKNNDVTLDPIVSVELVPATEYVYDLTVPITANFSLWNGLGVADTFHAPGQSEKNVTLGVPRLTEIINVARKVSTPTMILYLKPEYSKDVRCATSVARKMKQVMWVDLLQSYEIVYDPSLDSSLVSQDRPVVNMFREVRDCRDGEDLFKNYFLEMQEFSHQSSRLDGVKKLVDNIKNREGKKKTKKTIERLSSIVLRIVFSAKKLKENEVTIFGLVSLLKGWFHPRAFWIEYAETPEPVIRLRPISEKSVREGEEDGGIFAEDTILLKEVMKFLCKQRVCGVKRIIRVFVRKNASMGEYYLETEGSNIMESCLPEIDCSRTSSNDVYETWTTLGIEAARRVLIKELQTVLSFNSSYVNSRHIGLLADNITHRGYLMGINRHGINRIDSSILLKASFEETLEIFHSSARFFLKDEIKGISDSLMVAKPCPAGTGKFSVLVDAEALESDPTSIISHEDRVSAMIQPEEEYDPSSNWKISAPSFMTEPIVDLSSIDFTDPTVDASSMVQQQIAMQHMMQMVERSVMQNLNKNK